MTSFSHKTVLAEEAVGLLAPVALAGVQGGLGGAIWMNLPVCLTYFGLTVMPALATYAGPSREILAPGYLVAGFFCLFGAVGGALSERNRQLLEPPLAELDVREARRGGEPARLLDVCAMEWGLNAEDSATLSDLAAIFCANVIHISPTRTTRGLMWGASQRLHPGGRLFLYGPFKQDGQHTAPSNEAFDQSLQARNPEWGVRDINEVRDVAEEHGLMLVEIEPMPANNLILIFERRGG